MAEEKFIERFMRHKLLTASVSALVLVAIFFASGGMKWLIGLPGDQSTPVTAPIEARPEIDPLEAFHTDRQAVRDKELAQLNEIVNSDKSSDEARSAAQRQILDVCDWMEKEATIEGVLRARGYEDVVVTVHTDSVNVILRADSVTRADSAVILELAMRETGISGGNIKIIPIN